MSALGLGNGVRELPRFLEPCTRSTAARAIVASPKRGSPNLTSSPKSIVERGKGDEKDEDHLADEERLVALAELRGVGDLLHDRVDVERLVESLVAIAAGRARERRELSMVVNDLRVWGREGGAERDGVWGSDRASTRRASCPGAHPRGGPRGREG